MYPFASHEAFCLSPLHPGPCRGPRTTRREGVRGIMQGSGRLGAPAKAAPAKKAGGRAAPVPPQRGTVYGTPRKAAKKTAPPAKATGRANPGARASLPPTAQNQRRRSASQDAAGAALMAMKDSDGVRATEYADKLARRVAQARHRDRGAGNNDEYNRVVTEAALEMATILARQAGGDAAMQRHNRNDLANAISEAMRTGDISKVQRMKGELGLRSRTASAGDDCGCGSAEGEYNTEEIPEELYGGNGPDPRGTMVRRWSALLAPVGVPTGDGRTFAAGALTNRSLPLPLRWHREDEGGHKSVVVVGTIDTVEYAADGVRGSGVLFDPDPEQLPRLAEDIREARLLLEEGVLGPSVDLDDMEFTVQETAEESGPQARPKIDVSKGRISAATLVQIPAFAETAGVKVFEVDAHAHELATMVASVVGEPEEVVDDPTWTPQSVLREMNVTDEPEALLASVCAWSGPIGDHDVHLYPIRSWREGRPVIIRQAVQFALAALDEEESLIPTHERAPLRTRLEELLAEPLPGLVAGAGYERPPAEWFENPRLRGATPLTITEDGRVFGHLATWNTCHVGFPGACVTAPRSRSQYAYFHTGEMLTAEGEPVAVGRITLGGGHADTALSYQAAVAHYDDASTCVAYARAGEDEHGIWLAGVLSPETDELKAAALRAHPPSGDWRRVAGVLELMGAHAVNTPGFPVPRSRVASGAPMALVAAGALAAAPEDVEAFEEYSVEDRETLRDVVVDALREERKRERRVAVAVAALEAPDTTGPALRAHRAAAAFAMPAFIKAKIDKRKAEEDCDDDDEDCKKKRAAKKAGKGKPFGGKQAPPFGKK